jgi:hypothetical protein
MCVYAYTSYISCHPITCSTVESSSYRDIVDRASLYQSSWQVNGTFSEKSRDYASAVTNGLKSNVWDCKGEYDLRLYVFGTYPNIANETDPLGSRNKKLVTAADHCDWFE